MRSNKRCLTTGRTGCAEKAPAHAVSPDVGQPINMIQIPQHRTDKSLNDIKRFIPFIESIVKPSAWEICIEWCSGEGSSEIEKSAETPWQGNHQQFKKLYEGIFQTIDGWFKIETSKGVFKLTAVDSTFWEVKSDDIAIEEAFEAEYGLYVSPFIQPDE